MKIAIVTYSLMMGGIETVIFNQASHFINEGYETTIVETLKQGTWINYFLQKNLKVESIYPNPFFSKIRHVRKIARYLKEYDVVFLHDAPYAQSVLGLLSEKTLVFPVLHSELPAMIANATSNSDQWNRIVYVSPFLRKSLLDSGIANCEEIENIPNGIFTSVQNDNAVINRRRGSRFIYLGRLDQNQKAVLVIPDIIRNVLMKQDIEVVNIYGVGESYNDLRNRIRQLSLDEKIKLNGPVSHENVYEILQRHDYLLLPSFFEGHPIVLLEAMANRVIPFVSDLTGRTDFVVEHEVNGFLCKPADINDFSEKIAGALGRTDLEQIADRARTTIVEKFSVEVMGKKYIDLIKKEKSNPRTIQRSNQIKIDLLGDLPELPIILIRPVRKLLKMLKLWRESGIRSL